MKGRFLLVVALVIAAAAFAGCGGGEKEDDGGGSAKGPVEVTFWHGQTGISKDALQKLVTRYNDTHPGVHVDAEGGGGLAVDMLKKVTAGLAGGTYPDIAYIFGSDLANLARSDKLADLTEAVEQPEFAWEDFWPAARAATTVDGRVRAIPALIDDLAIIYNPELFRAAGIAPPNADWTWEDFREAAKQLTDPAKGQYGAAWPIASGEDVVWRLWPLVWQRGGEILTPDNREVAFDSQAGVEALELLEQMGARDRSMFLDSDPSTLKMTQAFISGRIAMLIGGPWSLPDVIAARAPYAVAPLPGTDGDHTTISGPDTYAVFDNGSARTEAATDFLQWLTAPEQDLEWDRAVQNLPLRRSTSELPEYRELLRRVPGLDVFVEELANARTRPVVGAYPEVSKAVLDAMVGVMLGRTTPSEALDQAAQKGNAALAGGVR